MGFYETLSAYYDEIFAVQPGELAFLANRLAGKTRLLDIGCGTGNKTVHFSVPVDNAAGGPGRNVVGIDLDPGMIAKARQAHARGNIRYEVMDMLDVDKHFAPASFDGVLCLGNTLPHLDSPDSMQVFLDKTFALLAPGGTLVLQLLNYDRIVDGHVECLPEIDTAHVVFKRRYAWKDGVMRFITALELKEGGKTLTSDIPLYPLRKEELTRLLQNAGYADLVYYGGFRGEPHDCDSFVTMAICGKNPV